jgi:hypothetical protein
MIGKARALDNMFELAIMKIEVGRKAGRPGALCYWGKPDGLHNCHGFFCCTGENKDDKYSLQGTMNVTVGI